jgi:hypothetical protein
MHIEQSTTSRKRTDGFNDLASALGVTSSGLRRYARRGMVPGAALIRGRWILRGPLTLARVAALRGSLPLNPLIDGARKSGLRKPPKWFTDALSRRAAARDGETVRAMMVAYCSFPRIPSWLKKQILLISDAGDAEGIRDLVYAVSDTGNASDDQLRRTLSIPYVRSHVFHDLRAQVKIESLSSSERQDLVSSLEDLGLDRN